MAGDSSYGKATNSSSPLLNSEIPAFARESENEIAYQRVQNKNNNDYSKHAHKDSGISASSDSHSIAGSPTNNISQNNANDDLIENFQKGGIILR